MGTHLSLTTKAPKMFSSIPLLLLVVLSCCSTTRAAALTTTTVAPRADFACPTEYGLYPDPENCTQYYECYEGNATMIDCPPGQLYSSGISECIYAEDVECDVDTAKRNVARQDTCPPGFVLNLDTNMCELEDVVEPPLDLEPGNAPRQAAFQ